MDYLISVRERVARAATHFAGGLRAGAGVHSVDVRSVRFGFGSEVVTNPLHATIVQSTALIHNRMFLRFLASCASFLGGSRTLKRAHLEQGP